VQQRGAAPQLIQRVLTEKAKKVLEQANENQANFTNVLLKFDTANLLERPAVEERHIEEIMKLPEGAQPALEALVQAGLLRHFTFVVLEEYRTNVTKETSEEEKTSAFKNAIKKGLKAVSVLKVALVSVGYGKQEMGPELSWAIRNEFKKSGDEPNLADHGVHYQPTGDPRMIRLCATYIPPGSSTLLGRAHSYLLYTDQSGNMEYISAHADQQMKLKASTGSWSPTEFPDKVLKTSTVATGGEASTAWPTMKKTAEHLNKQSVQYNMFSQNCNSAAHYILSVANYPGVAARTKMAKVGWDDRLEQLIGRPMPDAPPATSTTTTTTTSAAQPPLVPPLPMIPQPTPTITPQRTPLAPPPFPKMRQPGIESRSRAVPTVNAPPATTTTTITRQQTPPVLPPLPEIPQPTPKVPRVLPPLPKISQPGIGSRSRAVATVGRNPDPLGLSDGPLIVTSPTATTMGQAPPRDLPSLGVFPLLRAFGIGALTYGPGARIKVLSIDKAGDVATVKVVGIGVPVDVKLSELIVAIGGLWTVY
jgi:hypothetical protein